MNTPTKTADQQIEQSEYEPTRTGLGLKTLKRALLDNLFYLQGRFFDVATPNDYYQALAYTVRDRLLHRWIKTAQAYKNNRSRTVCYLSAEFLLGPHLENNIINLGIMEDVKQAVEDLGLNFEELAEQEEEPGLGNGGLGRLAACYMDSLATLEIPAIGYGIRYEFGIFDQSISNGWQVEHTDKWLHAGNPWELPRPKITIKVKLGGYTEHFTDDGGKHRVLWIPDREVKGVAYDTPIPGYRVNNANLLRLWSAEAPESFDFQAFNVGNYYQAVEQKIISENLTKVLYPNDEPEAGKQLRLQQQYFFVCCSLQDMLRIYLSTGDGLERFHEKYIIQLNDTHPSIAVAELMRILIDEHHMDWETAWSVTQKSFAYTNHTLLPEALEKWPVRLFQSILPRHLEIIYEINHRFLDEVRNLFPDDESLISRVSLIEEDGERYVRMANLAAVGSSAINGVAELHSELLKNSVLADFYRIMPYKFSNKTNGVTPRRFIVQHNPELSHLITDALGNDNWVRHLEEIKRLEDFADDSAFREQWIQVKRIHEYKRQHLNVLNIVTMYHHLKNDPNIDLTPRTFIFGGKAAPSYYTAKLIIKLINSVAEVVNNDPDVKDRIKVVFVPNYNVKNSQYIFPAADLSEQISLAGKEASGTGNMKFSMNGALTIGTLDGANIEIQHEVGAENFFQFGMTADEVSQLKAQGYNPREYYQNNTQLRAVMDLISTGFFSHSQVNLFQPLIDSLLRQDQYLVLADYESYSNTQAQVGHAYRDIEQWARKSILNVARMGRFSSDRAIREYCEDIWHVNPESISL
jgi:starch phosphorylase